jgi:small subunit ribosomal protein S16
MSVKIRLARGGTKKRPFYRIVVAESRYARDGRFIEKIGTYNPMLPKDVQRVTLDVERAKHWLGNGATPSERVAFFLADAGLVAKPGQRQQSKKHLPKAKAQERIKEAEAAKKAAEAAGAAPEGEAASA